MNIFYQIVPFNDGYHYMCRNDKGDIYIGSKNLNEKYFNKLIFNTSDEAQKFIEKHLEKNKYVPEGFWWRYQFTCPQCNNELTVNSVYNNLGSIDFLCTCENDKCQTAWAVNASSAGDVHSIKPFIGGED